jgi:hypothetical protein
MHRALRFHRRPIPLRMLELRLHLLELALRERLLLALVGELALEHAHPLAMLDGEPFGDRDGLVILDLAGEAATPLRIGESLPLEAQLPLGARERFLHFGDRNLGVDDRLAHLPGEGAQVRGLGRIEGGAESVSEALEQVGLAQLLRTVFAKKSEKTGSTDDDAHLGQAG